MTKGIFGLFIIGTLISFIFAEPPAYGSNNDDFDINSISSFLEDDATGSAAVSGKSYSSNAPSTYKPPASSYPLVQKDSSSSGFSGTGFNPSNYQNKESSFGSNYASASQSAPFSFPSQSSGSSGSQLTFPGAHNSAYSGSQSSAYTGSQSPAYPGIQSSAYPGVQSPAYPGVQSPAYPGAQSSYPGSPSSYPGSQSSYPGPPAYPGVQSHPPYPGSHGTPLPQGPSYGSYKYPHYPPGGASYNGIHPNYSPYQFEKPNLYQGSSPYSTYAGQYPGSYPGQFGPPKTSYQSPYKPTSYRPYSGANYKPSYSSSSSRYPSPSYAGKYSSSRPSYSPSPYTSNTYSSKPSYSGSSYSGGYKASASKPVAAYAFTDLF